METGYNWTFDMEYLSTQKRKLIDIVNDTLIDGTEYFEMSAMIITLENVANQNPPRQFYTLKEDGVYGFTIDSDSGEKDSH